jgi:hypothetical protein
VALPVQMALVIVTVELPAIDRPFSAVKVYALAFPTPKNKKLPEIIRKKKTKRKLFLLKN